MLPESAKMFVMESLIFYIDADRINKTLANKIRTKHYETSYKFQPILTQEIDHVASTRQEAVLRASDAPVNAATLI
jgi:hypothetical protein